MNEWYVAAAVLLLSLFPCGFACIKGSPIDRLVALELAGTIDVLILMTLAQAFGRGIFMDLAVALALLTFAGGLTFARFLERWV
ncbi:MAG: monovalent cation/H+ antiporter complex subunit F [Actinomycetota bacterium]|nr:monovalent cation/H+ antiporter complex subunit F [Actinomycetota bacterium]